MTTENEIDNAPPTSVGKNLLSLYWERRTNKFRQSHIKLLRRASDIALTVLRLLEDDEDAKEVLGHLLLQVLIEERGSRFYIKEHLRELSS